LGQDNQSFIDISHLDGSKSDQDRADESNLIIRKCDHVVNSIEQSNPALAVVLGVFLLDSSLHKNDIAEKQKSRITKTQFTVCQNCTVPPMSSAMAKVKTVQFRAQVPQDIDFLIRAIAPFKDSGKDWSLSDIVVEALLEWLQKPENRELIESHNILEGLERRGLTTNIYSNLPP
jgi:hypothetical protein